MKKIEVVAAIIKNNDEILCAQRGFSKYDYISHKFEFPGGKVEENETKEDAIIREIKEELHLDISNPVYFTTVEHEYPDFYITLHTFICEIDHKDIVQTEHINIKWLPKTELESLDWAEADIPIIKQLSV